MMSLANSLFTPSTDFLGTSHLRTRVMHFSELGQFSFPHCPLQQGRTPLFPFNYIFKFVEDAAEGID